MGIRQKRRDLRAANFDPDTPRCSTCKHKTMRRDLDAAGAIHFCEWHGFKLPYSGNGLCDNWRGKDGSTLEINT